MKIQWLYLISSLQNKLISENTESEFLTSINHSLFIVKRSSYALFFLLITIVFDTNAQNILINEFLASNVTTNPDNYNFEDYSDWIELYNAENFVVDLMGYYLTDDLENPTKWMIPADIRIGSKEFILIWADGNDMKFENSCHTNFKLSKWGEEIGLSDPNGKLIDSVIYFSQITDVSYGRKPDGGGEWFYFGEPTPGENNLTDGTLNTETATRVSFSLESGFYFTPQSLILNCESASAKIYYTTDGSKPSSSSEEFNFPVQIDSTSVIRARVFESDKLPGKITTHTYLINENHNLPVISLAVFPETFWDEEIGIYENSRKGKEMPVSVEFFEDDGELGFSLDAGIRITGEASAGFAQKSFTIEARERFGPEFIDYQIFPDRTISSYSAIYLRNGGAPDHYSTYLRDALQHTLAITNMDVDGQAYRPAVTYINGEYWGIYNIREKYNNQYFALHHNVNQDNLDVLESLSTIEGDRTNFMELIQFAENNDLSMEENYSYIKSRIDINEYMNYVIAEIYYANCDWMTNNIKYWRERSEGSKWRWALFDLDNGLGMESWNCHGDYSLNSLKIATGDPLAKYNRESENTALLKSILSNEQFRNEFIQRFASYINTSFNSDNFTSLIDSLQNLISDEMVYHIDRWKDAPTTGWMYIPIPDIETWNENVEVVKIFAKERPLFQRQHIEEYFGLSGSAGLMLNTPDENFGKVYINNVEIPGNSSNTYFKEIPLKLEAYPEIGYRFVEWQGVFNSSSDSISIILSGASEITAVFEQMNVNIFPSRISENFELLYGNSPYYARSDVYVDSGATLSVNAGVEILMPENASIYINGIIEINGSDAEPVTIKPNESSISNKWGALCIEYSTGHSSISHVVLEGATRGSDLTNHIAAISVYKSDVTLDNVTILDAPFPVFAQYGNIVVRNSTLHSEQICDLINIKYASSALVENCDLRGNTAFDTDAIDFDRVEGGIIRNNRIYNFYGVNSDGIDLGENAKNIIIEKNLIFNCNDKGISVGQGSSTIVKNNVIVNCAQGTGVKDDYSYAFINGNTFYGCDYGIASFEKNIGAGGGIVDVQNTIISQSKFSPYLLDDLSVLNISYSLSDTDELPGAGNILSNPLFGNDFKLRENSPAINSGNPASPLDADGSRIDIGANQYDESDQLEVFINEIHYNPSNGNDYEFIEIISTSKNTVDLSGFRFVQAINFVFPPGSNINPGEYIVLAKNSSKYRDVKAKVYDWGEESLPDSWANIELQSDEGVLVDLVSYDIDNGWDAIANGSGPSLELRNINQENLYTYNWQASNVEGGTPGKPNRLVLEDALFINEIQTSNITVIEDEYGDYCDWIELYNGSDYPIDIGGLYITDDFENPTKYQFPTFFEDSTTFKPGEYILLWADRDPDEGLLHLNFRLNSAGEELALFYIFESDTSIIDSVTWTGQEEDFSYGRTSDGSEEWKVIQVPTPGIPNAVPGLFENGILLVNGLPFRADVVFDAYQARSFWGNHAIRFWDLFEAPTRGYPSTLPGPIGQGAIPYDTLKNYSTVIWLGNFAGGGLVFWNESPIKKYLQHGGNLLLLTTKGSAFIDDEMRDNLGVNWVEPELASFENCEALYPGLVDMNLIGMQIGNSVFDTRQMDETSSLLFVETTSFEDTLGIGVWQKPAFGGMYSADGGQFVFISGRPFFYDYDDLKTNIDFILRDFFNEPIPTDVDEINEVEIITSYKLEQNYPNPFNSATVIKYSFPTEGEVVLKVFDVLGREVATLVNEYKKSGNYEVQFSAKGGSASDGDATQLSSGVYLYTLQINDFISSKKMLLIK